MSKKKTTEQFIKEARLVHGDKYDYSLVEYKNCDTKVKIKCNNCKKIFEQTPYCHTNAKQGCPTCSRISKNKKTTEQFIKEAKLVHGDKYDYSLVEYKDNKTKIKIVCNSCGKVFEQSPITHLHGCGCSRCVGKYKFTSEEWILLAKKKHNNDFDYSETIYDGYFKKVKIKCNKHNFVFETLPYSHLYLNGGCPKCKYEIVSQKRSLTTKEFIERCKKIHDYDYSITKYNGSHNTIKYICKKHGVVEQIAYYHLYGAGCPMCRSSKGERKIRKYLIIKKINFISQKTFNNLKDINKLSYDFYLPDYNLLIEYNGEQHYKYDNCFYKMYEGFLLQKHHDWLKRKYARDNNINLLTIPYWELSNIEKILMENKIE